MGQRRFLEKVPLKLNFEIQVKPDTRWIKIDRASRQSESMCVWRPQKQEGSSYLPGLKDISCDWSWMTGCWRTWNDTRQVNRGQIMCIFVDHICRFVILYSKCNGSSLQNGQYVRSSSKEVKFFTVLSYCEENALKGPRIETKTVSDWEVGREKWSFQVCGEDILAFANSAMPLIG